MYSLSLSLRLIGVILTTALAIPSAVSECPHVCEVAVITVPASGSCCFALTATAGAQSNGLADLPCSTATTCKSCKSSHSLTLDASNCPMHDVVFIYTRGATTMAGSGSVTIGFTLERRCGALPDTATLRGEAKDPVTGHLDCVDTVSVTLNCGC